MTMDVRSGGGKVDTSNAGPLPTVLGNSDMRRHNLAVVLRAVVNSAGPTRTSIARQTGLTKTAVGVLVSQMIDSGLITEGAARARVGRPSPILRLNGSRFAAISVEVQGTAVGTMMSDFADGPVQRWREATHGMEPADVIKVIQGHVASALDNTRRRGSVALAIVLAIHAAVDHVSGRLLWSPDPGWLDVDIRAALREIVPASVPVIVEHDATVTAIAEFHSLRQDANVRTMVAIASDLGIGAGLIIDGKTYRGSHGFGAELGHILLDPSGPECNCGRKGCWASFIGLRNVFREALPEIAPKLEQLRGYEDLAAEALLTAALNEDGPTIAALQAAGTWLGRGAASAANFLDPDVIVVGGYLVPLAPWVLPPALQAFGQGMLRPADPAAVLRMSVFKGERVLRGSLQIALERLVNDPLHHMESLTGPARP
jgi:predicted NBD/HSP70 family sugar kinase